MMTKLIKLSDGTLIEADITENEVEAISGGAADRVESNLERIKPIVLKASEPLMEVLDEIGEQLDFVEAEIGLAFEGEGNIYITKVKAKANISVKLKFSKR